MTLAEVRGSTKEFLTANDIAGVLCADPHAIRDAAHREPQNFAFPVLVVGKRVKIPRLAFIKAIENGTQKVKIPRKSRHAKRDYVIYDGERVVAIGTMKECMVALNKTKETLGSLISRGRYCTLVFEKDRLVRHILQRDIACFQSADVSDGSSYHTARAVQR